MNGVPLRRVNQAYVIATSMKIDISKVKIPVVDDSYFAREESAKKTDEDEFFNQASKVLLNDVSMIIFGMNDMSAGVKIKSSPLPFRYHRRDGALRKEGA